MKLDALKITVILLIAAGSILDLATTKILLSIGSVSVGDTIISFSEANPLFHILGHGTFRAVYFLVTVMLIALVLLTPRILPRDKLLYQVALMKIKAAFYGA